PLLHLHWCTRLLFLFAYSFQAKKPTLSLQAFRHLLLLPSCQTILGKVMCVTTNPFSDLILNPAFSPYNKASRFLVFLKPMPALKPLMSTVPEFSTET